MKQLLPLAMRKVYKLILWKGLGSCLMTGYCKFLSFKIVPGTEYIALRWVLYVYTLLLLHSLLRSLQTTPNHHLLLLLLPIRILPQTLLRHFPQFRPLLTLTQQSTHLRTVEVPQHHHIFSLIELFDLPTFVHTGEECPFMCSRPVTDGRGVLDTLG